MSISTTAFEELKCHVWSDPLVGLQVCKFHEYVQALERTFPTPEECVGKSEYLCDWSRVLLNRAFGRTSAKEWELLTELFAGTADLIDGWSERVGDADQRSRSMSYASHIRQRTGLVRHS